MRWCVYVCNIGVDAKERHQFFCWFHAREHTHSQIQFPPDLVYMIKQSVIWCLTHTHLNDVLVNRWVSSVNHIFISVLPLPLTTDYTAAAISGHPTHIQIHGERTACFSQSKITRMGLPMEELTSSDRVLLIQIFHLWTHFLWRSDAWFPQPIKVPVKWGPCVQQGNQSRAVPLFIIFYFTVLEEHSTSRWERAVISVLFELF